MASRFTALVVVGWLFCACGGAMDSPASQKGAGGATAQGGSTTNGGSLATGGTISLGGVNASGGWAGSAGTTASAGATSIGGMQCGWESIYCGGLSPDCPAGQTFVFVAACSGPCVSTEQCPADWEAGRDVLTVGVWLIGVQGDVPSYSVLRFLPDHTAEFSAPKNLPNNQAYFPCLGIGDWGELQLQGTMYLGNPTDCSTKGTSLRFEAFHSAEGHFGAAMRAEIRLGTSTRIEGYWFPSGSCGAQTGDCPI